tara:strand:- start:20815 stop:21840 length:1026 start_codon:yes stop_codon:yes gene_type:complete
MIKYLLYPFAWLFGMVVYVRNKLYDFNMLTSINSKLPVISVGNIVVGGSGKTPFVIAVCKQLISHNIKPLVITRGYKRNTKYQIILNDLEKYSAEEVGDEPYYIKHVLKNVSIIIDHNKKNAIQTANQLSNIDCVILDDGFQSRYINRDLDIVLSQTRRLKGQEKTLLPVGLLREPISNTKRADLCYGVCKEEKIDNKYDTVEALQKLNRHHLFCKYTLHKYKNNVLYIKNSLRVDEPCVAFCGIANPSSFIGVVKKYNRTNINKEIIFENHAKYDAKKYQQLKNNNTKNLNFITTYKDFVKLEDKFKNENIIYVLEMNLILKDEVAEELLENIKRVINEN